MHACLLPVFFIHALFDVIYDDRNMFSIYQTQNILCLMFLFGVVVGCPKKQNQVSSIVLSTLVIIFMV